jgi:drug/metabolite transporter (DMT)-like permease
MKLQDNVTVRSEETVGLLLGLVGVVCFSVSLPATRVAVKAFDATFVSFGRAVVAAVCSGLVLAVAQPKRPTGAQWKRLVFVAAGVVIGFPLFTGLALRHAAAGHGAVVIGLLPAATAGLSVVRAGERPSARYWFFAMLGMVAIAVLAFARSTTTELAVGDVFFVLAVACAAVGYTEGAMLSRQLGGWQTISWSLLVALPVTLPLSVVGLRSISGDERWTAWAAFAYLGVVSMFLGFFAWYAGLAKGGIARVSQVQLIQPLLSVTWAVLFLHERVDVLLVVVAVVVLAAVFGSRRSAIGLAGSVGGGAPQVFDAGLNASSDSDSQDHRGGVVA